MPGAARGGRGAARGPARRAHGSSCAAGSCQPRTRRPAAPRLARGPGHHHQPLRRAAGTPSPAQLRRHLGVDLAARRGQLVGVAERGVVLRAGWNGDHGKQVEVQHDGQWVTRYSHLSRSAGGRPARCCERGRGGARGRHGPGHRRPPALRALARRQAAGSAGGARRPRAPRETPARARGPWPTAAGGVRPHVPGRHPTTGSRPWGDGPAARTTASSSAPWRAGSRPSSTP